MIWDYPVLAFVIGLFVGLVGGALTVYSTAYYAGLGAGIQDSTGEDTPSKPEERGTTVEDHGEA
ncbi:hypothetical protein SAMN05216226_1088 [Halovenus aranensis]|uniref:Uncharacterized protein n=1 Tax=Halovenus aranensis TaxID=890420 RepID=A0A1G8W0K3_9EURY|nr:hypothetical protein [Halovenus aranensis]SDJ71881.1 hypothetical protein SAMN05216226_1088 [Halovenus aranensis]